MADHSKIEWTDSTWNPVTGCSKVSQGCKNCYALRDWNRLAANPKSVYHGRDFTDVACHYERLDQPLRWRKPRRIFVNSMSDLFHEAVVDDFIADVFAHMALAHRHTFQVLTKRPERMRQLLNDLRFNDLVLDALLVAQVCAEEILGRRGEFDPNARCSTDIRAYDPPWPLPNVWLGVSVEDQATADERITLLLDTPAAVRWISAEPLLGPLHLVPGVWINNKPNHLNWVVAGGESCRPKERARPSNPEWFRHLANQCVLSGTPFLFKQWGEWSPTDKTDTCNDNWVLLDDGETVMYPVGKKRAGRTLDGQTWDEYPA